MLVSGINRTVDSLRLEILEMIHRAGRGYCGAALSCLDILAMLYFGDINGRAVLRYDSHKPGWEERDYLVLSQWYSAPALYAVLARAGFFDKSEIASYGKSSLLKPFPDKKVPGVEATVLSLASGLALGIGIGLTLKVRKSDARIYVLAGSAELQCGVFWESVMSAFHYKLDNLVLLIDNNRLQSSGEVLASLDLEPLAAKFESCGWKTMRVIDGHGIDGMLNVLNRAWKVRRRPVVLICDTISAKGLSIAEGKPYYFASALSDQEFSLAEQMLKLADKKLVKSYE